MKFKDNQNEHQFNGAYSEYNVPKLNDGTHVTNFDQYMIIMVLIALLFTLKVMLQPILIILVLNILEKRLKNQYGISILLRIFL